MSLIYHMYSPRRGVNQAKHQLPPQTTALLQPGPSFPSEPMATTHPSRECGSSCADLRILSSNIVDVKPIMSKSTNILGLSIGAILGAYLGPLCLPPLAAKLNDYGLPLLHVPLFSSFLNLQSSTSTQDVVCPPHNYTAQLISLDPLLICKSPPSAPTKSPPPPSGLIETKPLTPNENEIENEYRHHKLRHPSRIPIHNQPRNPPSDPLPPNRPSRVAARRQSIPNLMVGPSLAFR